MKVKMAKDLIRENANKETFFKCLSRHITESFSTRFKCALRDYICDLSANKFANLKTEILQTWIIPLRNEFGSEIVPLKILDFEDTLKFDNNGIAVINK